MKAVPPADWFGWDGGYHTIEEGGVTRRFFGEGVPTLDTAGEFVCCENPPWAKATRLSNNAP
jgi:hypothetical protein